MKKINYLFIAVIAISAAFTSCSGGGSGSSKGLNGTFVGSPHGSNASATFSGNRIKLATEGYDTTLEGVYELVEEYKEDDFSRGNLIVTDREGQNEMSYVLEGKGKMLTLNYQIFIKEGTKSGGAFPDGIYEGGYSSSFTFTGNKFESDYISGTYELFVIEPKGNGNSIGAIKLTYEESDKIVSYMQRYQLDGDKLTIRGETYTKR